MRRQLRENLQRTFSPARDRSFDDLLAEFDERLDPRTGSFAHRMEPWSPFNGSSAVSDKRPCPEVTASVLVGTAVQCIHEAHARWEDDCLQLDLELSAAGLPFGASGYKLATERGAYRLIEGVTGALTFISRNIHPNSQDWRLAHRAILDAVDQIFLASSRLVPAPKADPVLAMVSARATEQVTHHCEEYPRRWWTRTMAFAVGRTKTLFRRGSRQK